MRLPTWKEMSDIDRARAEKLARHLRRLLATAERSDECREIGLCSDHPPLTADDIRTTMILLDKLLSGCDFRREDEYHAPCDVCGGRGWTTLTPGAYSGVVVQNACLRCRGTGLLIPESYEEGR